MEINPAVTFKHDRSIMYAKRPKVVIVGAGLAGITLGMLLHKAGIPFEIYERAAEVKPLGSAMYFSATTAYLFKQCEIYDEFTAIAKEVSGILMCTEQREVDFKIHFVNHEDLLGSKGYMVTRPQLYDLLRRQIPKERFHFGKKVLTMAQGGNGVLLRFSDGTEAEGDILVGADGAYSAVRQNLYAQLLKAKKLPPSDVLPLPYSTICLVGQTRPLTPEEFPDVALEESQFRRTIGTDKMYSFLTTETSKENDAFKNSEWGQEAAMAMCEEVKDFAITSGGENKLTMGDLFAWTNKSQISKVMLEEKVFTTWHNCRTVLVGDACHKLNPAGGAGASNALHDAIVLANVINGLPFHPVADEIEAAFKAYQDERMQWVLDAFKVSQVHRTMVGQIVGSKGVFFYLILHLESTKSTNWVMRPPPPECKFLDSISEARPCLFNASPENH
ncbi:hypothetical protein BGZ96_010525 [Linnemannia gamsii]|uniref:FAD-binding domain-containing protein n=1 Tax=Linnemannia gamsii TaxID=64522 RepID=A0ABQ7JU75_9FUNG|nr:hypothetical protein BGZ96_010525 [Linnemannia gamsii]